MDVSVHQVQLGGKPHAAVLVHERLGRNRDARNTLDARRRARGNAMEGASRGYHPRRGRRYDSGEDRSSKPDLPGPQAFGRHILNAAFSPWYSEETKPRLWLEDYRLVKLVERIMTISLSATLHCSWPIQCERHWNTFRPTESKVRRT